jgi:clan AA aspartic protease (TIGR02281 family)
MGDYARAKDRYRQILTAFPNTPAAEMATEAIKQLDPGLYRRLTGVSPAALPSGGEHAASDPSLPESARLYFNKQGESLIVDGEVNNRSIKMVFDTGAETCVFGKNHLQQLGITPPSGPPDGMASGVGSAGVVKTWNMKTTLKVGGITRRNFPVTVQEVLPTDPLLGQTFFSDYTYVIDNGAHSIAFHKRGHSASTTNNAYAVPFTREGKEMIVNVEVNGKGCPMIFDTGAEGTAFSADQVRKLGISIPDDAETQMSTGIGGTTTGVAFNVERMKLGPIEKRNIKIGVVDASNMPRPLLGQNFYGDWQYTIDNSAKMIHFLRR